LLNKLKKWSEIEQEHGGETLDNLYAKILDDNQDIVSRISEAKNEQALEIEREDHFY
jgi:hypothetical protein